MPILMEGEGGSGKETLAEYIHALRCEGDEKPGSFVRFCCGQTDLRAASEELFGSGGRLQKARGGTLFLKHLHLLHPELQKLILLTWQSSNTGSALLAGARVVASSTVSLEQLVSQGKLLPDLYFRASAYKFKVPPLRERSGEVVGLFRGIVESVAGSFKPIPYTRELCRVLEEYRWPGNIRELENLARGYALHADPERLIVELLHRTQTLYDAPQPQASELSLKEQVRQASKRLESDIILRSLEQNQWNRRRTAGSLGISYRALLYKMKDCNLLRADAARAGGR